MHGDYSNNLYYILVQSIANFYQLGEYLNIHRNFKFYLIKIFCPLIIT